MEVGVYHAKGKALFRTVANSQNIYSAAIPQQIIHTPSEQRPAVQQSLAAQQTVWMGQSLGGWCVGPVLDVVFEHFVLEILLF